eukprot:CAMPEP_0181328354 /NCGR_PEP_ID=MMETSP1101-20121128/22662_1 /TAXON_ID=46948 /ORGANISM="Rhodomonas abbreviata, Strain Caron Lab Isolate" /LENGTH=87 /DNA_ID=CAMNT_0023437219 /DNA_START=210 /DNA_END=474 /DNA_ORIENTATION=+
MQPAPNLQADSHYPNPPSSLWANNAVVLFRGLTASEPQGVKLQHVVEKGPPPLTPSILCLCKIVDADPKRPRGTFDSSGKAAVDAAG